MFGNRMPPMMGGGFRRRNQNGMNPFMMLMFLRLAQEVNKLPVKPPGTLGMMGVNAYVHLLPMIWGRRLWYLEDVCMNAFDVVVHRQFQRVLLSPFVHLSDYHLYYNLTSFLYKGVLLEQRVGTPKFVGLTLGLLLLSQLIYIVISFVIGDVTTCAVGFSGVLFALKVVVVYDLENPDQDALLMGFRLPNRHIVWAELGLIYLLIPQSSFVGHLSGILAGFIYLALRTWSLTSNLFEWIPREPPRTYGAGTWGEFRFNVNEEEPNAPHNQPEPGNARFNDPAPPERERPLPPQTNLSAEQLRRRRVERFS